MFVNHITSMTLVMRLNSGYFFVSFGQDLFFNAWFFKSWTLTWTTENDNYLDPVESDRATRANIDILSVKIKTSVKLKKTNSKLLHSIKLRLFSKFPCSSLSIHKMDFIQLIFPVFYFQFLFISDYYLFFPGFLNACTLRTNIVWIDQ